MRKQVKAALASVMVAGGMIGLAAPAAAAQEGNAGPWEMPDVRGEKLSRAISAVLDVTGDVDLDVQIRNRVDTQAVINYTAWEVCAQGPRAGTEISKEDKRVILAVRRPNTSGC